MNTKTIAAVSSLIAIIMSLSGIVWYQSALAAQTNANTEAIRKLEAMPERLVRVETKLDTIIEELHAN